MLCLLLGLARERPPLGVRAKIRLRGDGPADASADNLLREFRHSLIRGHEGINGGFVLHGEEGAKDVVFIDDFLGEPACVGKFKDGLDCRCRDHTGLDGIDQRAEPHVLARERGGAPLRPLRRLEDVGLPAAGALDQVFIPVETRFNQVSRIS